MCFALTQHGPQSCFLEHLRSLAAKKLYDEVASKAVEDESLKEGDQHQDLHDDRRRSRSRSRSHEEDGQAMEEDEPPNYEQVVVQGYDGLILVPTAPVRNDHGEELDVPNPDTNAECAHCQDAPATVLAFHAEGEARSCLVYCAVCYEVNKGAVLGYDHGLRALAANPPGEEDEEGQRVHRERFDDLNTSRCLLRSCAYCKTPVARWVTPGEQ